MIKYLGSKRTLVPVLGAMAAATGARTAVDLFTGTTRVAQEFKRRGMLVTAGQLAARENEFLTLLAAAGLRARRLASEGEWLGTLSVRE